VTVFLVAAEPWAHHPVVESRDEIELDTLRVKTLRESPQVKTLLRSLATAAKLTPANARVVDFTHDLPAELAFVIERVQTEGRAWQAWRTQEAVYAVSAELDETASRIQGHPVLTLYAHDDRGRVTDSSSWMERSNGEWVMRSRNAKRGAH